MADCKVGDIVKRPWGEYEILALGPWFKVKRLRIHPGRSTSRQFHRHRTEYVFSEDSAGKAYQTFEVAGKNQWHQLSNDTADVMELLEVQIGQCLESDIIREEVWQDGERKA